MKRTSVNSSIHVFTIIPLVVALIVVAFINLYQSNALIATAENIYRSNVIDRRETELKNYVDIARGAFLDILLAENLSDAEKRAEIKSMMRNMRFGDDGYFFAYDYDGINIVLAGQPWREGKNWINMEDDNGVKIIQELINNSTDGGGYSRYVFDQPSRDGTPGKKLAYSERIPEWQWMFGTGVYLDDIDNQVADLTASINNKINTTFYTTLAFGVVAVIVVFIAGQFILVSEKRYANQKLRELNQRIFMTQEEECKRFSRELHDGVSQNIAAARYSIETAQIKQQMGQGTPDDLDHAMTLIQQIMLDIRAISHKLHPRLLVERGLSAALDELGTEFNQRTGIEVSVERLPVKNILSEEVKTTLYRIAQEAITNIERHANATRVSIALKLVGDWLEMTIEDNGSGFKSRTSNGNSATFDGIGLRNIRERLHFYDGNLLIHSAPKLTQLVARIPRSQFKSSTSSSK